VPEAWATWVKQQPPFHHPLEACYDSVAKSSSGVTSRTFTKKSSLVNPVFHRVSSLEKERDLAKLVGPTTVVLACGMCPRLNSFTCIRPRNGLHEEPLNEPAPTSAPWRMDDKWSGNSFLLDSSSLANHHG
jgi:hypothetical protein